MNHAEMLAARMTEMEKMNIRRSDTEDAIVARYFDYRPELSGGNRHGGTVEEGIAEMKQVREILMKAFIEGSKNTGFGRTWTV